MCELKVELEFKLTVRTAAMGIAAFMKTEIEKKQRGGCEGLFKLSENKQCTFLEYYFVLIP